MRKAVVCWTLVLAGWVHASQPVAQERGLALPGGYRLPMAYPVGGYWPWERLESAAKRAGSADKWQYARKLLSELKTRHHWNTVWVLNIGPEDGKKFLEIAEAVGVWVLLEPSFVTHHFIWQSHASPAEIRQTAKKVVDAFGRSKALAGYVFVDEPRTISMGFLEAMRRAIRALDPSRICLTVSMLRDTQAAAHRTGLPVLVTDIYPFGYPRDPNLPSRPPHSRGYYRASAAFLERLAEETGKRPWIMPQIFQGIWGLWYYDAQQNVVAEAGAYLHWRMPTVGETRWQVWCALAHNAKGVLFYVLFPPHHPRKKGEPQKRVSKPLPGWRTIAKDLPTGQSRAMLYPNGTPTPQMSASSEVFAFIARQADLLARLKPVRTEVAYAAAPACARSFRDPTTDALYTFVYTDNTDKPSVASVSFLTAPASVRDMRTGKKVAAQKAASGLKEVRVSLRPGDGTLLALGTPANLPLLVMQEDFRLNMVMHKLSGARRTIVAKPYGLGWDHGIIADPSQAQPAVAGTVTCRLTGPGGDSRKVPVVAYPKDATVYVVYRGALAAGDQESLILALSKDGKQFVWASTGVPHLPVRVPPDTATLRFEIKPGARLTRFDLIAVPHAPAKAK